MAGKGSKSRPIKVPQKEYDERWDAIFKKKTEVNIEAEVTEIISAHEKGETEQYSDF